MSSLAFAVPGALTRTTGGTIYDRRVIEALRASGHAVQHVELPDSYPDPTPADEEHSRALLAALGPDRPVVIDGLALGAMAPATLAALTAPLIAMVHHPLAMETGVSPARAAALRAQEAANLRRAAAVIVPSPHTGRLLAADYGVPADRISVALPGTEPPDPVRAPVAPPLILTVGSLAPRKGHDTLLDALALVADLQWQAEILGATLDPVHADRLLRRRAALALGPRVSFVGAVGPDRLTRAYRAATLFALATRYEGYGMVFAEAMLHGLPIVACATGAVPDTVPPQAGLLVPPDDPPALAAALRHLLTDAAARQTMAAAATRHGTTLPRWPDTARVFSRVLAAL